MRNNSIILCINIFKYSNSCSVQIHILLIYRDILMRRDLRHSVLPAGMFQFLAFAKNKYFPLMLKVLHRKMLVAFILH